MRTIYALRMFAIAVFSPLSVFPNAVFSQASFYQGKTIKVINNDPGGTAGRTCVSISRAVRLW